MNELTPSQRRQLTWSRMEGERLWYEGGCHGKPIRSIVPALWFFGLDDSVQPWDTEEFIAKFQTKEVSWD